MIRFEDVSFGYGDSTTVDGLSFTVGAGEFVALAGANGAGKSTTAKLVNGLLRPRGGKVTVCGRDTRRTKVSELAGEVGFLFQNPDRQICQRTVREEILFGLRLAGRKDAESRADAVIRDFGLDGARDPFALSRGERQRIALASLIALEPRVLILDEPTTGLDYRECMHIMERVRELNGRGVTVLMVCHDMELVLDFAARMLVLAGGALLADGAPRELFRRPELLARASLLPPQMIELSERLTDLLPPCDTAEELARAAGERRGCA